MNNLPVPVTKVGGALAQVTSSIELYTDERFPLTRKDQYGLARMMESRPELNTEPRVALLVDAIAHHGVEQLTQFGQLLDTIDVEVVYLAVDYLYEIGKRGRGASQSAGKLSEQMADMDKIRSTAELAEVIVGLNQGIVPDTEQLHDYVTKLGGLNAALDMSDADIETVLVYGEEKSEDD